MYKIAKYNQAGNLHSEEGPAVECLNGDEYWYYDGKLQNLHGPAYEGANGTKCWYFDRNLHRWTFDAGPAVETADGEKHWYLFGTRFTEEEYNGSKFLSKDEIFMALNSQNRDKLIIGGLVNKEKKTVAFFRGGKCNLLVKLLTVPFSVFDSSTKIQPNFDDLSIVDNGQTIKFGFYEASVESILS
jgi:hypothetical protein